MIGTWTEHNRGSNCQYHLSSISINLSQGEEGWHVSMSFVNEEQTLIVCPLPAMPKEKAKQESILICKQLIDAWAQQFREVL